MARHKDAISFDHCCSKMDGLSWSNQTGCYSCMQLKDISGKLSFNLCKVSKSPCICVLFVLLILSLVDVILIDCFSDILKGL